MNFISQAASTRGTHKGMHDGEGTTGAWQREGTAGTHDGERTSGAWQEGGHDRGAWQGACIGVTYVTHTRINTRM